MECRIGCGACCIAPSISSPMPGMPYGKPAGVRCLHLTIDHLCALYGKPERPAVCSHLRATTDICGETFAHAIELLMNMERITVPPTGRYITI
ncbi:MAG: YkgJ family cysteine cluster protein [Chloroflexota bacterium]|nr:YkgJ family cysteine cluster protein [Chloroflexota bacterium]